MSYDTNVYDNPEKHGLEIIGELRDPNESYDFDTVVFWKSGRKVYAAHDSGCSCPSPFEGYNDIKDLERITRVAAAQQFIESFEDNYLKYDVAAKRDLLAAVGKVLRGA